MKILHTTLCFCATLGLWPVISNGQDIKDSSFESNRAFSLGVTGSANYGYRYLKTTSNNTDEEFLISRRDDRERPSLLYAFALRGQYRITRRWLFESGLQYSARGYETERTLLTYAEPEPNAPVKMAFHYRNDYLDVPLKVNFYLSGEQARLEPYIMAGLVTSVHLKGYTISKTEY